MYCYREIKCLITWNKIVVISPTPRCHFALKWLKSAVFNARSNTVICKCCLYYSETYPQVGLQRGGKFPETFQKSQEDSQKIPESFQNFWKVSKFCNPTHKTQDNKTQN